MPAQTSGREERRQEEPELIEQEYEDDEEERGEQVLARHAGDLSQQSLGAPQALGFSADCVDSTGGDWYEVRLSRVLQARSSVARALP